MAPSLSLPLSTFSSFSFSSLSAFPTLPARWDEIVFFYFHTLLSETECLSIFFSSSSCGGKHMNVYLSLPGSQRTATCNLRQSLYFLPRRSLKSPAEYVCVHLEVGKAQYQCWHKAPVTGSGVGRGWAVWPCWILGLHYAFMFSLRCYVLSPGQLGHIFNGPFGWKTV